MWQVFPLSWSSPITTEWFPCEDLGTQMAVYDALTELNLQVKRSPVSHPLAQTVLCIGTSLALPTSSGTDQHLTALQESKTQVTRGQRKVLPESAFDQFPLLLFWNSLKDDYHQCVGGADFFFHRHSFDPQICSSRNVLTGRYKRVIRPGQLECAPTAQKTINYMLTGSQLFNHIPWWLSIIKQIDGQDNIIAILLVNKDNPIFFLPPWKYLILIKSRQQLRSIHTSWGIF